MITAGYNFQLKAASAPPQSARISEQGYDCHHLSQACRLWVLAGGVLLHLALWQKLRTESQSTMQPRGTCARTAPSSARRRPRSPPGTPRSRSPRQRRPRSPSSPAGERRRCTARSLERWLVPQAGSPMATAMRPDTARTKEPRTARRSYGSEQALPCRAHVAAPSSIPFCACAPSGVWHRRRTRTGAPAGLAGATRGRLVAGMVREGKTK